MIRLVIGKLDYGGVSGAPAITFKKYDGSVRLDGVPDIELKPLTKLIIRLFSTLGIQFDVSNVRRLGMSSSAAFSALGSPATLAS
jgi:hypothetical protein